MKVWLVALAACSATPRAALPTEAPRQVASAYHVGGLRIEGAPPIDPAIAKALQPFVAVPQARVLDFDGSLLVSERGVCVELPGDLVMDRLRGASRPLKPIARRCDGASWAGYAANGEVAFVVDREDEESVLFSTAEPKPIASGRITDPIWDRTRTRLLFGRGNDELWLWETGKPARQIAGGGPWAPLDVSEDGGFAVVRRELATTRSALYLIALATGDAVALTEVGDASVGRARFTSTGDLIAIADGGREHRSLIRLSTRFRAQLAPDLDGDVTDFVVIDDTIVFVTARAGVSTLRELDLVTGRHRTVARAPTGGVIADLRATDSGAIAFSFTSPTSPRRAVALYLQATREGVDAVMRWPDAPAPPRLSPDVHDVVASDGITTSLQAYVPAGTAIPVVVELHGGPEDRWLPKYDGFAQFLAARGYAVIRPNVRGSAGQGRSFLALDDGRRREDVLRDIAATLDWISAQPNLDRSRVAVMGTSYGGLFALAALNAFPDRLRGGITLGAITDLVGFLEGTAPYRRDHRRAEYGDERDPDVRAHLAKISPVTWVGSLTRPLLMAFGQRDPRVPAVTHAEFLRAARAARVPVWSIAAADEGHWFERPENRQTFEVLAAQFLATL